VIRVVALLAFWFDWLKQELERPVDYDPNEEFLLILPPVS
jgi:hypothetical protein